MTALAFLVTAAVATAETETEKTQFAYGVNASDWSMTQYRVNPETGTLRHNGHLPVYKYPVALAVHPSKRFIITAVKTGNKVAVYRIDATSGRLTEIPQSPFNVEAKSPYSVSIHPSGRFVYVAARWGGVVAYTMDVKSGVLTLMPGSPFAAQKRTRSVKVHPSGHFVYANNAYSNNISAYRVNEKTGALSPVTGSPFSTGEAGVLGPDLLEMVDAPPEAGGIPYRLEIHPSGRFVYVTNRMGLSLSVYNVDAETGVLTSLKSSPVKTGGKPYGVTAHPSGKFVYVTSQDTRTVWGYRINQDNGELTPLSDSPYSSHGAGPLSITFNTAGNRAYVTNVASNSIAQFSVNTGTGSLSLVETIRTRYEPFYIVLLETEPVNIPSRFDYLTKGENGQLTIQRLNALKGEGLPENPAREKNLPRQLPHSAAIEPRGRFVYTTYDAGDESDKSGIASYRIDSGSGKLVPLPENILSLGFVPTHMAINVSGRLLYAVNPSVNSIGIFTIDPESGALSPVKGQLPTTGEGPVTIALDPVGRFSFVANSRSDTVSVFTHIRMFSPAMYPINRSGSNFAVGDNPVALAVDPTGKFLVVANKDSNNLSVFSIHFHKGQLEAVKGSPFPSGNAPVSVAMHPSGKFVYVLNADSGDISSYRLDPLKGGLSVLSRRVNAGKRPVSMMLDSEGRFAYVKNKGTNGLRKYTVDSESGLLTFSGELDRGSKVTFVH